MILLPRRRIVPLLLGLSLSLPPGARAQEKPANTEKLDLKALFEKGIPASPFAAVVYRYADTMIERGRDTHGARSTGLFLSALDRETLSPLDTRPDAPAGVPDARRPGRPGGALRGADPQLDQNFLRLLYLLKGLSSQDRYPAAADAGLKWFLRNAQSAETGLYPWGERLAWETFEDEATGPEGASHEFCRPWMLWEKCFQLAPEASARFARSLRDRVSGPEGAPDPRQAGFRIRTWAEAHAHTDDPAFKNAIEATLEGLEGGPRSAASSAYLSLAIDCAGAARRVPEPLRSRLLRRAAREDDFFCSLPHELETSRGFVLDPARSDGTTVHTPRWDPRQGGETTARLAMMCVSRHENAGPIGYRDLITAAADLYLDSLPSAGEDAWPMTFGHAIALELSAFRITADRKYFRRAFALGELAVKEFFGDSPLPRASLKTNHYESTTGADTLVLALTELHLTTRTITAVRAPANTIDR